MIPIVDIFAGPGGLGEGFSSFVSPSGKPTFKIALSIEKDCFAHQTLMLRSFYRQFPGGNVPEDYYKHLSGEIERFELFQKWPAEAFSAFEESWNVALGDPDQTDRNAVSNAEVDEKIDLALKGAKDWLLIGGPPCQAYSVVGRVRRKRNVLDEAVDKRVGLYKQYLRILAVHNPTVFVMENVKGLLSASTPTKSIFSKILEDLTDPVEAYSTDFKDSGRVSQCPGYHIYSLVVRPKGSTANGKPIFDPADYVIRCEKYGIPQTRHRVILLGVRKDVTAVPEILDPHKEISVSKVIAKLPRLRSGLTSLDSDDSWMEHLKKILRADWMKTIDVHVRKEIKTTINNLNMPRIGRGKDFIRGVVSVDYNKLWFIDDRLQGICNHISRGHMLQDLHRYLFVSSYAAVYKCSPSLQDFPEDLLPAHKNVKESNGLVTRKFADRFRVQLRNKPSKTITSHISQDGHYYIHFDPSQCRTLTVREAARIQTFPDNYYFCGPKTSQYIQVGNAVPPLLANKIATIVNQIFGDGSTQ